MKPISKNVAYFNKHEKEKDNKLIIHYLNSYIHSRHRRYQYENNIFINAQQPSYPDKFVKYFKVYYEKNMAYSHKSGRIMLEFVDGSYTTIGLYKFKRYLRYMSQMKKLYLSGPMSVCKDEKTWKRIFNEYENIFTDLGFAVVNPAKNPILKTYEECLKHSLKQEMECDYIFFLPNAILSTGARLEYEVAKACGIKILTLDDNIDLKNNYGNNSGIQPK